MKIIPQLRETIIPTVTSTVYGSHYCRHSLRRAVEIVITCSVHVGGVVSNGDIGYTRIHDRSKRHLFPLLYGTLFAA